MLQSMRLQRVGHDWATELNWTCWVHEVAKSWTWLSNWTELNWLTKQKRYFCWLMSLCIILTLVYSLYSKCIIPVVSKALPSGKLFPWHFFSAFHEWGRDTMTVLFFFFCWHSFANWLICESSFVYFLSHRLVIKNAMWSKWELRKRPQRNMGYEQSVHAPYLCPLEQLVPDFGYTTPMF